MNPACASLGLVPGDTLDVSINVYSGDDGNQLPLQMAAGEVFVLTLGNIVASSAANGDDRLHVLSTPDRTTFTRQFSPIETSRFRPSGRQCPPPMEWSFVRIPVRGVRRTYAGGSLTVPPRISGPAIQSIDLVVADGGVTIELGGVPDVASYTDAIAAALRTETATQIQQAETLSAAFALLL